MRYETKIRAGLIKMGMNMAGRQYNITAEKLNKMPIQVIASGMAYGKTHSKYWNPVYFYPKGVKIRKNELGHDRSNRYVLKQVQN